MDSSSLASALMLLDDLGSSDKNEKTRRPSGDEVLDRWNEVRNTLHGQGFLEREPLAELLPT
jgi:hypothetical protein